jgi:hypothetical protein
MMKTEFVDGEVAITAAAEFLQINSSDDNVRGSMLTCLIGI